MDIKKQLSNKIQQILDDLAEFNGSFTSYEIEQSLSEEVRSGLITEAIKLVDYRSTFWGLTSEVSDCIFILRDLETNLASSRLYPLDLKYYYFTFNFEATYLGFKLRDKCIPVKALSMHMAKCYISAFIKKEKKTFKKVTTIVCEEIRPKDVKFILPCPDIHNVSSTNHFGGNFQTGFMTDKKIVFR